MTVRHDHGVVRGLALLMMLGGAAPMLPPGPLSTRGNQIIDSQDHSVRILSIGAFSDVSDKIALIAGAGFNTIRLDWGNRSLKSDNKLAELDRVVLAAGQLHMRVILDDHSNESAEGTLWKPCFAQQVNGLWYDLGGASDGTDGCDDPGTVTDEQFVKDWEVVATHYRYNDTVIGYDIWNEPLEYGKSTWEPGNRNPTHNIRYMYERVGNAILAIDPSKLIICEGPLTGASLADRRWPAPWGDLSIAGRYPVNLLVPNKLVYSVHDYPTEIGGFSPDSGPTKVDLMNKTWGYLVSRNIAPVWIGEMGGDMLTEGDKNWARTMIDYANGNLGGAGGPVFGPQEQGIGIDWWYAGYDPNGKPTGIFGENNTLNERVRAAYRQFFTYHSVE